MISKKGMVFLVKFAMPNLLWSLIYKKYTVFHVKFAMPNLQWSLISKKYIVFHVKFALKFDFEERHDFSGQICNAKFTVNQRDYITKSNYFDLFLMSSRSQCRRRVSNGCQVWRVTSKVRVRFPTTARFIQSAYFWFIK